MGGPPGGLKAHSACVVKDEMLVLGGLNGRGEINPVLYFYSPYKNEWRVAEAAGEPPSPRYYASAHTYRDGSAVALFGGLSSVADKVADLEIETSIYLLDVEHMHWVRPLVGGAHPTPRFLFTHCGHSFFNERSFAGEDSIIVLGGVVLIVLLIVIIWRCCKARNGRSHSVKTDA